MKKIKEKKSNYTKFLKNIDKESFNDRLNRLKFLTENFIPNESGYMIAYSHAHLIIYDEIQSTFLNGAFISSIILCQDYFDCCLKNRFRMFESNNKEVDYLNYDQLIKKAKYENIITEKLYEMLDELKKIRNRYTHLPPSISKDSLELRMQNENKEIIEILEEDAKKSIKLFFLISAQMVI